MTIGFLNAFHWEQLYNTQLIQGSYDVIDRTPNMIHKDFFSIPRNFPTDFTFDIFVYFYCRINKFTIRRPRIKYTTRLHGQSHWQKGLMSEIKLTLDVFKYKQQKKEILKNKF